MIDQPTLAQPGRFHELPTAVPWIAGGALLVIVGGALEGSELAQTVAPDSGRLALATLILRWYWGALVLITGVLVWREGREKELFRRYLPMLLVSYALARALGAISFAQGMHEGNAVFPAAAVSVALAFVLVLLHWAPAARPLVVAANWVFVAVVWATLESGRAAVPDLLGAFGIALAAFPLALRPASRFWTSGAASVSWDAFSRNLPCECTGSSGTISEPRRRECADTRSIASTSKRGSCRISRSASTQS